MSTAEKIKEDIAKNEHNAYGANLFDIMVKYPTEEAVLNDFIKRKYPHGVFCPHCGSTQVSRRKKTPKKFQCNGCNNSFSVFKSTVLQNTRTDLRKWIIAIQMIVNAKKGVSAYQIQRTIGCTYKCCYRMGQQIRQAMTSQLEKADFQTIIECDETYVGAQGKYVKKTKRGRGTHKTPVIGVYNRNAKTIHAKVAMPNKAGKKLTGKQLLEVIEEVATKSATVHTDEFRSYRILGKNGWYHFTVDHSSGQYAKDGVHVNNVESFWSLLKRGIVGSFHHVSDKKLQRYIDEFCWRFNNRKNPEIFNDLIDRVVG